MSMPVNCSFPCQPASQQVLPANLTGVWGVDCNGTFTFVPNAQLTVPDPNTVQLVRICPGGTGNPEFDTFTLCDPNDGRPIIVVVSYSTVGVPTATAYEATGVPYAGVITSLVSCSTSLESDAELMCDDAGSFIRWYVKNNGQPTGVTFDTDLTGAPYVPSGPVTLGPCTGSVPVGSRSFIIQVDSAGPFTTPVPVNPYSGVTILNRSATVLMRATFTFAAGFPFAPGDDTMLIAPGAAASANFKSEAISRVTIEPFDNSTPPGSITDATTLVPVLSGGVHPVIINFVNG